MVMEGEIGPNRGDFGGEKEGGKQHLSDSVVGFRGRRNFGLL